MSNLVTVGAPNQALAPDHAAMGSEVSNTHDHSPPSVSSFFKGQASAKARADNERLSALHDSTEKLQAKIAAELVQNTEIDE